MVCSILYVHQRGLFLEIIFDIILISCIAFLMFSTGLLVEPKEIISYFRNDNFILTLRVVAANIIIVPLLTSIALLSIPFESHAALILFVLAISPAAPFIPAMVYLNKGDMNWALALIIILTIISLITIPLMVYLGSILLLDIIGLKGMVITSFLVNYIVPIFVPLIAAIGIKIYRRPWADNLLPISKTLFKYLNLLLIIMILVINYNQFSSLDTSIILISIISCVVWALIGYVSVYPVAETPQYITAIITTGFRNFAVGLLLLDILANDKIVLLYIVPISLITLGTCLISSFFLPIFRKKVIPIG